MPAVRAGWAGCDLLDAGAPSGMASRYTIRPSDAPGLWDAVSVETGEAVQVNDALQVALPLDDADDVADLLERAEAGKPERPG